MKEWGEITRFLQEKDQEAIQREKDLIVRRKREVRSVLQAQIQERAAIQGKQIEERKRYEQELLEMC